MLSCVLRILRKLLGKMTTATMATPTTSNQDSSDFDVSHFRYTPYYCEENAYFLCKKLCESGMSDARDVFLVFISNENKQIPLWHQKASNRADGIVLWDYHVICIQIFQDCECTDVLRLLRIRPKTHEGFFWKLDCTTT